MTAIAVKTNGIKSTEFWITVVATNVLLFSGALGLDLDSGTVYGVVTMVVGYAAGRSWFKGKAANGG